MFIATLFTTAKNWKPKNPSTVNDKTVRYSLTTNYSLTTEGNKLMLHTTKWLNLKCMMLHKEARHKTVHTV